MASTTKLLAVYLMGMYSFLTSCLVLILPVSPFFLLTLRGDKVNMFACSCLHKPLRKTLKWPCAITRPTIHFMCGLVSDLVICKVKEYDVMYKAKCSYWSQDSVNNIKCNLKLFLFLLIVFLSFSCVGDKDCQNVYMGGSNQLFFTNS